MSGRPAAAGGQSRSKHGGSSSSWTVDSMSSTSQDQLEVGTPVRRVQAQLLAGVAPSEDQERQHGVRHEVVRRPGEGFAGYDGLIGADDHPVEVEAEGVPSESPAQQVAAGHRERPRRRVSAASRAPLPARRSALARSGSCAAASEGARRPSARRPRRTSRWSAAPAPAAGRGAASWRGTEGARPASAISARWSRPRRSAPACTTRRVLTRRCGMPDVVAASGAGIQVVS